MVLQQVIRNGVKPCPEVPVSLITLTGGKEPQERVVREVGSKVSVIAKPTGEETLQPPGMTVVEFLEGPLASLRCPFHQLFIGLSRQSQGY